MKLTIKDLISRAVENDYCWGLLDSTILKVSRYAEVKRNISKTQLQHNLILSESIENACPYFLVKYGAFKGMKYPKNTLEDRVIFPKILGTYERELEPVIERLCQEQYTEIVNIGCGEGYYAVGLALRIPTAKVYAYDTNKEAIRLCREMAQLNNVDQRLILGSFCDTATLKNIPFTKKGLIFCDCEGFEKELFTKDTVDVLLNCDLLIEIHDFIDINISSYIYDLFKDSHEIEVIESIDDIKKAKTYNYKEIEQYDLATRKILLGEYRPSIMEWFYIKSRN